MPTQGALRPLGETINYEEDKELSPEKDDEKPLYESSEGPIPKSRQQRFGTVLGPTGGSRPIVGKSSTNLMINSGESFGMMKSGGLGMKNGHGYLRETISNDFLLQEHDEDEEDAISRVSAESGEFKPAPKISTIQPIKKRWTYWNDDKMMINFLND